MNLGCILDIIKKARWRYNLTVSRSFWHHWTPKKPSGLLQNNAVREILGRNASVESYMRATVYIVGLYARRKYNVQQNGFKTSLDTFLNF